MAQMFSFDDAAGAQGAGPQGGAAPMGGGGALQQGGGQNPGLIMRHVAETYPNELEQILDSIARSLDAGEITPEQLSTLANLANTTLANPSTYSALAKFATQNGFVDSMAEPGTEAAANMTAALALAAFQMQQLMQEGGLGAAPGGAAGPASPEQGGNGGGMFSPPGGGPGGTDGFQQDGRYMMPADAVRRLGTDFLDKKSAPPEPPKEQQGAA